MKLDQDDPKLTCPSTIQQPLENIVLAAFDIQLQASCAIGQPFVQKRRNVHHVNDRSCGRRPIQARSVSLKADLRSTALASKRSFKDLDTAIAAVFPSQVGRKRWNRLEQNHAAAIPPQDFIAPASFICARIDYDVIG